MNPLPPTLGLTTLPRRARRDFAHSINYMFAMPSHLNIGAEPPMPEINVFAVRRHYKRESTASARRAAEGGERSELTGSGYPSSISDKK